MEKRFIRRVVMYSQNGAKHHRLHDLLPALAQRGDGAVVVEDGVTNVEGRGKRFIGATCIGPGVERKRPRRP